MNAVTRERVQRAVPATCVLERRYDAKPARVFRAFSDPQQFRAWHVPGKDWSMFESVVEFRAGGRHVMRFGPQGGPYFRGEGRYEDIVPDARIVTSFSMHDEGQGIRMSSTLCTVEFIPDGNGTCLILTDQSMFYAWETPDDRKGGWSEILDKLARHLKP
jgi:uncharacterized protein YndB with AHSA1/START domain